MRIRVPITTANALLSANYTAFTQIETGAVAHKTDVYSIPADMQQHLAAVYPTTQYVSESTQHISYHALQAHRSSANHIKGYACTSETVTSRR